MSVSGGIPLCVDLDGTLIKTDLLVESFFILVKRNPFALFQVLWWMLRGKAYLKERIAAVVDIDAELLPYDQALLARLRMEKQQGRKLVLATAAHRKFAQRIVDHLSLFDEVHATEGAINLAGERKRNCLVKRFGQRGFDYVGNDSADLSVWAAARESWLVDASPAVRRAAALVSMITVELKKERHYLASLLKGMRVHQWLKNILLFVPVVAAHKITDLAVVRDVTLAFFAFGLCASSVYLLNDLLDLPSDRRHPRKRHRSFASGAIPVIHGLLMIPALLILAMLIAAPFLPWVFFASLAAYYVLTLAYSFWAKERVVVDILFLTLLYTMRLIAGGAATSIELSFWLLAFSVFLFLSLALIKRYAEMLSVKQTGQTKSSGRGYNVDDMPVLQSMGVAAGYLAVLVLALYINSPDVRQLYANAKVLWLLCVVLLFWVSRIWMITSRGQMHDDPVIFAAKDRISQLIGVILGVTLWLGT